MLSRNPYATLFVAGLLFHFVGDAYARSIPEIPQKWQGIWVDERRPDMTQCLVIEAHKMAHTVHKVRSPYIVIDIDKSEMALPEGNKLVIHGLHHNWKYDNLKKNNKQLSLNDDQISDLNGYNQNEEDQYTKYEGTKPDFCHKPYTPPPQP